MKDIRPAWLKNTLGVSVGLKLNWHASWLEANLILSYNQSTITLMLLTSNLVLWSFLLQREMLSVTTSWRTESCLFGRFTSTHFVSCLIYYSGVGTLLQITYITSLIFRSLSVHNTSLIKTTQLKQPHGIKPLLNLFTFCSNSRQNYLFKVFFSHHCQWPQMFFSLM